MTKDGELYTNTLLWKLWQRRHSGRRNDVAVFWSTRLIIDARLNRKIIYIYSQNQSNEGIEINLQDIIWIIASLRMDLDRFFLRLGLKNFVIIFTILILSQFGWFWFCIYFYDIYGVLLVYCCCCFLFSFIFL